MNSEENKHLEDYMSGKDPEKVTKSLVRLRLDRDLKQEFSTQLKENYGIDKKKPVKKNRVYRWAAIVVILCVLIISYVVWHKSQAIPRYEHLAELHLSEPYDLNALIVRGQEDSTQVEILRREAGEAYSDGLFAQAAVKLSQIEQLNGAVEEDYFYLGLSYLYGQPAQIDQAVEYLEKTLDFHSTYEQESRWYLGLALLKDDKIDQAKAYLNEMVNDYTGHYRTEEASELLRALDK